MPTVHDVIVHCQKQIKKDPPAEKLLHYLSRLDRLRVTVEDLMNTGVGRMVNQLSRHDGDVGQSALKLVQKWKAMVSDENSDTEDSRSSSGESEDRGDDEEDSDKEERRHVRDHPLVLNGFGHNNSQKQRQHSESDEFNEDSDDDRLCIADEIKKDKSTSPEVPMKQEKMSNPSDDESDNDEYRNEYERTEDSSIKHSLQHIKSERLSESGNSDDSDFQTQVIPQKSLKEHHHKKHKSRETEYTKDHYSSKKDHNQKHKSSSERSSHKHHHSDKEKTTKEKCIDKTDTREIETGNFDSQRIKIKVEPNVEEIAENHRYHHKSSKKKEKSSKRHKEDKEDVYDRHKNKKKDHKDRRNELKSKHKKEQEGSESDRKRKTEDSRPEKKTSSSPDRKKIKLEDAKYKDRSPTKKPSIHIDEEINSASGVKFEELLGCLDKNLTKSKEKHKEKSKKHTPSSTFTASGSKEKDEVTKLMRRNDIKKSDDKRKKHLESIIAPTLNISPNYKPPAATALLTRPMIPPKSNLSNLNILESCDPGNYWEDRKMTSYVHESNQEDTLSSMMSSRNQRTKVFSGRTVGYKGAVPKLFDLCMQVIQENIEHLGYTGGVPFEILKPALERASAEQLFFIEEYNPYLVGSTDELWKFHCNREFRGRERQEMETWRELFERCKFERDEKFAIVRKKMLKKGEVAEPVRKAKLAYVEPIGGPRFNRQKAATIKNGMKSLKIKEEKGPRKGVGTSASVGFNNPTESTKIVEEHAVLINPESRAGHGPVPSASRGEAVARCKPRKAPLMAKTMKFIKTLQRR